ncbi:hypothetical protein CVT24_010765 [Panaeolus cyanescens]|uniref:Uncharacterized protein n=1 Tax=Panaeolus cyanescens TaxID=181874 RepID=A0A409YMC1_9AGAR|nr:hypothetical protein CVT24_010765 [Panaeolus cyanescens]
MWDDVGGGGRTPIWHDGGGGRTPQWVSRTPEWAANMIPGLRVLGDEDVDESSSEDDDELEDGGGSGDSSAGRVRPGDRAEGVDRDEAMVRVTDESGSRMVPMNDGVVLDRLTASPVPLDMGIHGGDEEESDDDDDEGRYDHLTDVIRERNVSARAREEEGRSHGGASLNSGAGGAGGGERIARWEGRRPWPEEIAQEQSESGEERVGDGNRDASGVIRDASGMMPVEDDEHGGWVWRDRSPSRGSTVYSTFTAPESMRWDGGRWNSLGEERVGDGNRDASGVIRDASGMMPVEDDEHGGWVWRDRSPSRGSTVYSTFTAPESMRWDGGRWNSLVRAGEDGRVRAGEDGRVRAGEDGRVWEFDPDGEDWDGSVGGSGCEDDRRGEWEGLDADGDVVCDLGMGRGMFMR